MITARRTNDSERDMARNKEALAIILDVGPGMIHGPAGEQTCLQVSIDAVNMILQRKLFSESKDEIALVLFGTADTGNDLADGSNYENITVARPLRPVDWDLLQYVQNNISPGGVSADFLDALVVTMDHLQKSVEGKKGFGSKHVILFSNLLSEFGDDQLDNIIGSMKEAKIEFDVIGTSGCDEDDDDVDDKKSGPKAAKAKPKTPQQRAGELLVRHILEAVDGSAYSFEEALPALSHFQSKQVQSTAWNCLLEIGSQLKIPISLYTRVKEAKAKSFKTVYAKDGDAEPERLRTHHLNDDAETEVDKSDIADGHRYGSTLVPFSSDDKEAMKYKTEKCFKVLGFTKFENIKRHQIIGDSSYVCLATKDDESAVIALSALINALYETQMVTIVRRVYAANGAVRLGCLVPHIKASYECLFYTELPFAEDIRQFTFGSLPVSTANVACNKKFTPTDDQLAIMDELIDVMNPSHANCDVDGDEIEAIEPKLTFNPYLQRLYQCLQHRAFNSDESLPELSANIKASLQPPQKVAISCQPIIEKMKQKYKLEHIPKKEAAATAGNIFNAASANNSEPLAKRQKVDGNADLTSGLSSILKTKVTEVGSTNPIEDFQAIISNKDEDRFADAHEMMQIRIMQLITDSFGSQFHQKSFDCLVHLRQESIKNREAKMFNDFLIKLKTFLSEKGRLNFWDKVAKEKLTLISKAESGDSSVSNDEAKQFLSVFSTMEVKEDEEQPDADNLLDEME